MLAKGDFVHSGFKQNGLTNVVITVVKTCKRARKIGSVKSDYPVETICTVYKTNPGANVCVVNLVTEH